MCARSTAYGADQAGPKREKWTFPWRDSPVWTFRICSETPVKAIGDEAFFGIELEELQAMVNNL